MLGFELTRAAESTAIPSEIPQPRRYKNVYLKIFFHLYRELRGIKIIHNNQSQLQLNRRKYSHSILVNTSTKKGENCFGKVSIFVYKYFTSSSISFSNYKILFSDRLVWEGGIHVTNYKHSRKVYTFLSFNFHTLERKDKLSSLQQFFNQRRRCVLEITFLLFLACDMQEGIWQNWCLNAYEFAVSKEVSVKHTILDEKF